MSELEASKIPEAPPLPESPILTSVNLEEISKMDNLVLEDNFDLNLIVPNLYLGSFKAASNLELLKHLSIGHIITLAEDPLDDDVQKHVSYKFKQMTDSPSSDVLDILDECIEFIESGVATSNGVLVHWLAFNVIIRINN